MSMEPDASPPAQASDSEISLVCSYYVLGVLFTVYVSNFIDRAGDV